LQKTRPATEKSLTLQQILTAATSKLNTIEENMELCALLKNLRRLKEVIL
jgi:hypothetical protein